MEQTQRLQAVLLTVQVCSAIPKGKVSTYGALSLLLKSSPRAVGQALRRNPYAPQVPCHRVVAASLELGGFSGAWVRRFSYDFVGICNLQVNKHLNIGTVLL